MGVRNGLAVCPVLQYGIAETLYRFPLPERDYTPG
jgi:hypothetical protein